MTRAFIALLAYCAAATAQAAPLVLLLPPLSREATLKIGYRMDCDGRDRPLLHSIDFQYTGSPEIFRAPLFRNLTSVDLPLRSSKEPSELTLTPVIRQGCRFEMTHSEMVFPDLADPSAVVEIQAKIHSPMIVPRRDQLFSRWTDVPLRLYYTVIDDAQIRRRTILYTTVISDEDAWIAKSNSGLDIEWVYEVTLSLNDGSVLERRFQGQVLPGTAPTRRPFRGALYENSQHPILYTVSRNNIFSDRPALPWGMRSWVRNLLPLHGRMTVDHAREHVLLAEPWLVQTRDQEALEAHKTIPASTEYFYVRVSGASEALPLRPFLVSRNLHRGERRIASIGPAPFVHESWIAFKIGSQAIRDLVEAGWRLTWRDVRGRERPGPQAVYGYYLIEDENDLYRWRSALPVESTRDR